MKSKLILLYSYLRDKEVSFIKKTLLIGSILYFILPVDLVPDFIIGLGWVDDLVVFIFIWNALKSELRAYKEKQDRMKLNHSKIIDFDSIKQKKD